MSGDRTSSIASPAARVVENVLAAGAGTDFWHRALPARQPATLPASRWNTWASPVASSQQFPDQLWRIHGDTARPGFSGVVRAGGGHLRPVGPRARRSCGFTDLQVHLARDVFGLQLEPPLLWAGRRFLS